MFAVSEKVLRVRSLWSAEIWLFCYWMRDTWKRGGEKMKKIMDLIAEELAAAFEAAG